MFSSNQEFVISGSFDQLQLALEFAINYSEENKKYLCFQKTEDGKYCIGWAPNGFLKMVGKTSSLTMILQS